MRLFTAVTSGKCEFGLIPIENSLAGSIHQNYDLLLQNELYIVGEYFPASQALPDRLPGSDQNGDTKGNQPSAGTWANAPAICAAWG